MEVLIEVNFSSGHVKSRAGSPEISCNSGVFVFALADKNCIDTIVLARDRAEGSIYILSAHFWVCGNQTEIVYHAEVDTRIII